MKGSFHSSSISPMLNYQPTSIAKPPVVPLTG